ncbi:ATP-binding protein [Nocardioides alcanivorans]|uniref:ATP-binding protein n=1 Tax=Nocardioides alcanivorans TaxID=2897352 RepID=UPI001F456BE7|nr:ATP-binding protein [Nocardioides alcanivorans]
MTRENVVVTPDTRRMVEGLRDTGYTFNSAVADLIDNSIAADASRVSVYLGWTTDEEIILTIADDGHGMNKEGLLEAMRYGAPERATRSSLGRFGLGLKTASTGFCRRLTVMSRDAATAGLNAAVWDLDDLAVSGEWNLGIGPADADEKSLWEDAAEELADIASGPVSAGTVVMWQKVDKLLKTRSGEEAKNRNQALKKTERSLVDHLEMVFQRYLDSTDDRVPNVAIAVNGNILSPWDPFQIANGGQLALDKTLKMSPAYAAASSSDEFEVKLRAFILPRKDEYQSDEARTDARIGIDRQGIYLYRENRMIEGPEWLGTGATETHLNTLRVDLSFPGQLDEVFGVGIKKSGVHIDPSLIEALRQLLTPVRREADRLSRKGKTPTTKQGGEKTRPTERTINRLKGSLTVPTIEQTPGGAISLKNNAGEVAVRDDAGKETGIVAIVVDEDEQGLSVVRHDTLEDGALWEARYANAAGIQVALNAGHSWYRKAYLPNAADSNLVQAIEYLFYALAQAEMNNTDTDAHETFAEFRIEVSRNLKKLVKDLPDPDDD